MQVVISDRALRDGEKRGSGVGVAGVADGMDSGEIRQPTGRNT